MYNPQNLHQCELEKKRKTRVAADSIMTVVGVIASVSSIPQVLKIWESGDVSGISLTTQALALGAVITWFLYGIYIHSKPLIITSFLSSIVLATVVAQIILYS